MDTLVVEHNSLGILGFSGAKGKRGYERLR